ncbi:MAG: hypothetical protein DME18_11285 [Verrucomicrobia bacterium]|nr:MAG: hypothetical protein DME18_11285 [Verrucomicrobiota bacterium]
MVSAVLLSFLLHNELAQADGCPAPSFAPAVNYQTGSGCWSVAVGDFNGDGKLDLAAANSYTQKLSVLLGNGDGTFQTAVGYGAGSYYQSVAVGDFNGDGNPDLAVPSVMLGNGDGTFQAPVSSAAGTHPGPLAVADFNRDGKLDLAVANIYTDQVSVLLGDGDGTFQKAVSYGAGWDSQSVAVGDFNGDGNPDLAVPSYAIGDFKINAVSILLGNGDGTFQSAVDYGPVDLPVAVASGDFNRDGKLDFAVANNNSRDVSVLLGKGDGTFQHAVNYGTGIGPRWIVTADFNSDGHLDLASANEGSGDIYVLLNNGDGGFQIAVNFALGVPQEVVPRWVAVGDFNGDGKPDLAVANERSGNVSVLLNTCASAGVNLVAARRNNALTVSWPLPYTNFVLESATNLGSRNWQGISKESTTNNGRCEVTVPLDQGQRYFRLHKP